jgi:hypothetical protein
MLTFKVPGEGFHDLEVADFQKVLEPHAARLSDKDLLTAGNEPDEDFNALWTSFSWLPVL